MVLSIYFYPFPGGNSLLAVDNRIFNQYDTRTIALQNSSSAFALEGSSNDLNPAGAALIPFYRASALVTNPGRNRNYYAATITDAKTSSVAGSVSFHHLFDHKVIDSYAIHIALAQYLMPNQLIIGMEGYYMQVEDHEAGIKETGFNGKIGAIYILMPGIYLSMAVHNPLDTKLLKYKEKKVQIGFSQAISQVLQYFADYIYLGDNIKTKPHFGVVGLKLAPNQKFELFTAYGMKDKDSLGSFSGGVRLLFAQSSAFYAFQQKGLFFAGNTHSLKLTFDF